MEKVLPSEGSRLIRPEGRILHDAALRHTSTFMTRSPRAEVHSIHLRKRGVKAVNPEPGQVSESRQVAKT